jgi:hypothetical protein
VGEQASVGGGNGMILLVPLGALADVKQFDPFPPVAGAPFAYPGGLFARCVRTLLPVLTEANARRCLRPTGGRHDVDARTASVRCLRAMAPGD